MNISKIKSADQDKNSDAWKKLCEYIEIVADEKREIFSPIEYMGADLYLKLYTLPESISTLKSVTKISLYGSQIKRLPPEIGQMSSLEYFDIYCSYNLFWLPYEIIHCTKLKSSRISTRALYGNYKHRKPFPDLTDNPVRYESKKVCCSICKKEIVYEEVNQLWISLWVASDTMPLLVNLCSEECKTQLPSPPFGYYPQSHKGGNSLNQRGLGNPFNPPKKSKNKVQPTIQGENNQIQPGNTFTMKH